MMWLWMNGNKLLIKSYDSVWKTIKSMLYDPRWIVRTFLSLVKRIRLRSTLEKYFVFEMYFIICFIICQTPIQTCLINKLLNRKFKLLTSEDLGSINLMHKIIIRSILYFSLFHNILEKQDHYLNFSLGESSQNL